MKVQHTARSSFRACCTKPARERTDPAGAKRKGVVLISVLVVVVLLSLAAYQYSAMILSEYKATENGMRLVQARAFANSGIHYAAALLSNADNLNSILAGNPFSSDGFAEVEVPTGFSDLKGKFRFIAPAEDELGGMRQGVQDESGKINVNGVMKLDPTGKTLRDMLGKLGIPDDVADAIVDWLDADSTPRDLGAESDYYLALSPGYQCKNGPIDSLEELLLVRGVTPELLYGTDKNRNGVQDEGEDEGEGFSLGWSAFLTVYGRESLIDPTTKAALIDVNGDDLQTLYDSLSPEVGEDLAKFMLIYRLYGTSSSSSSSSTKTSLVWRSSRAAAQQGGTQSRSTSNQSSSSQTIDGSLSSLAIENLDLTQKPAKKLDGFFSLINAEVTIKGKDAKSPSIRYKSPLNDATAQKELLPKLFEKATTNSGKTDIYGRINVNTASLEVLRALPGLAEGDGDKIYAVRPKIVSGETPSDAFKTPAWLMTEAGLSSKTVSSLEKYVTTQMQGMQVYRVQVIGYFDNETMSPSARVEAVIDVNNGRPRLLYWRDLSELGTGAEIQ